MWHCEGKQVVYKRSIQLCDKDLGTGLGVVGWRPLCEWMVGGFAQSEFCPLVLESVHPSVTKHEKLLSSIWSATLAG